MRWLAVLVAFAACASSPRTAGQAPAPAAPQPTAAASASPTAQPAPNLDDPAQPASKAGDRPCEALSESAYATALPAAKPYERDACYKSVQESLRRPDGSIAAERALPAYSNACEDGCADACQQAGILLRIGPPATRNAAASNMYLWRACAGKSGLGCSHLGLNHRLGYGTPQNYERAREAFTQACDLNEGHGCGSLGDLAYHQTSRPDGAKAGPHYFRGCALRDGGACAGLAELHEKGDGVARDPLRALKLYTCGCRFGHGGSCADAGRMVEARTPRTNEERELFRKALAQAYGEAVRLNTKGCDDGEPYSCSMLGNAYRDGKGVPRDLERARKLYRYGCDGRMAAGCDGLKSLDGLRP